jgi:hypothetical protein
MGTSICFNCPYDHYNIGILGDAKPTFKLCSELVKERKKTNKQTNKQTTNNKEITTLHKELGRNLHINAK